jgi:hypothetical protein
LSDLQSYFTDHTFGFWVALLVAIIVVAGWVLYSSLSERRARAKFYAIIHSADTGNVPAMLAEYLTTVREVDERTARVDQRVAALYDALPHLVRHVGLVRFSPFHDTGGDQSFSLALLDGLGDGIVISALHSRHDHKLYAKPVVGRQSTYQLTSEEQQAIVDSVEVGVAGSVSDS